MITLNGIRGQLNWSELGLECRSKLGHANENFFTGFQKLVKARVDGDKADHLFKQVYANMRILS